MPRLASQFGPNAEVYSAQEYEALERELAEAKQQRNDECRLRRAAEQYAASLQCSPAQREVSK